MATTEEQSLSGEMKSFTNMVREGSPILDASELNEEDVALILYTSGTTGTPKGAMLTHKNLYSNAKDTADYLAINGEDLVIAALPMFHVFCLTVALNAPLMNGGNIIILQKFYHTYVFMYAKDIKSTIFFGV